MRLRTRFVLTLLAAIAISGTGTASAVDFITYTDEAAFKAALASYQTDTFNNLGTPVKILGTQISRSISPYSYNASSPNGLVLSGSAVDPWLTSNTTGDSINFAITAGAPTAMGGYFFTSNVSQVTLYGTISVSINGGQYLQSVTVDSATNFFGWISPNGTQITDFQASTPLAGPNFTWATVNDLILAQAIPEPSTYALSGLAALVMGIVARRRRSNG